MMNRKGQIPILMLFLVAIVLVVVALVSFSSFSGDFGDKSLNVSKTLAGVEAAQTYVVESAKMIAREVIESKSDIPQAEFVQIAASKELGVQEAGNFFAKIRNDDFGFEMDSEGYRLKVEGLFVQYSYGNNQVKRDFGLCLLFDKDGKFLGNCL